MTKFQAEFITITPNTEVKSIVTDACENIDYLILTLRRWLKDNVCEVEKSTLLSTSRSIGTMKDGLIKKIIFKVIE